MGVNLEDETVEALLQIKPSILWFMCQNNVEWEQKSIYLLDM
jgi:hypothetical protein